jgi:hypothetical protein
MAFIRTMIVSERLASCIRAHVESSGSPQAAAVDEVPCTSPRSLSYDGCGFSGAFVK